MGQIQAHRGIMKGEIRCILIQIIDVTRTIKQWQNWKDSKKS